MYKGMTALVSLFCSMNLVAASNWYLIAENGVANSNINRTDIDKMLVQQQLNARTTHIDDSDSALALHVGYQLKPHLALELGYMDLGERVVDITGVTEDVNAFYQSSQSAYPEAGRGVSIALASAWNMPYENWSLTGRLGYFDWSGKYNTSNGVGQSVSNNKISGLDTWFGLSLAYQFESQWQASINVKRVNLQRDDNNVVTLGLGYHF